MIVTILFLCFTKTMCSGYLHHSSLIKEAAIIVVVVITTTIIKTVILWGLYRIFQSSFPRVAQDHALLRGEVKYLFNTSFINGPSSVIVFLLLLLLGSLSTQVLLQSHSLWNVAHGFTFAHIAVQEFCINHSKAEAHLGTQEVWIGQLSHGRVFSHNITFTQQSDFNSFSAHYTEKKNIIESL